MIGVIEIVKNDGIFLRSRSKKSLDARIQEIETQRYYCCHYCRVNSVWKVKMKHRGVQ